MLGAIIGDVAGSYYEVLEVKHLKEYKTSRPYEERIKILDRNVPLFDDFSTYTDDTVLTCAIYDAIKNGNCDYKKYLKEYGLRELELGKDNFNRARFGKGFVKWLTSDNIGISYGNGAAMRISPVGYLFNDLTTVQMETVKATIPSHNNVEAITGAMAVSTAIFLLRNNKSKEEVINYLKEDFYDLEYNLEELQRNNRFSSRSSESVPVALYVFSISTGFEDAIRKAISVGGDSDTIACIVGSLAEACYGVDENLKEEVKKYLNDDIINLLNSYYGEKEWKK
ncbi:MAG: ADP-ribosylglycohydrolase family protein [Bacilli bacterium]|nr:ADP-ribosylglycohydrolase family protein [Bacilli bacterium]